MTGSLLGTVLRGMRSRALLTVGSIILTALAIGSAVLGPMFQVASTNSYVVTRLNDSPNPLTGLSWEFRPGQGYDGEPDAAVDEAIAAADKQDPGPFLPPSAQLETPRLDLLGGEGILLAKGGACDHVVIVAGTCPTQPGEALILEHDLEFTHLAVGDRTAVRVINARSDAAPLVTVRIVGAYQPRVDEGDYWFDLGRLTSEPAYFNELTGARKPYTPAPLIVDPSTFELVPTAEWVVRVDSRLDVPPDWDADDLRAALATAAAMAEPGRPAADGLTAVSINDLATIATEVRGQEATAKSSIAPAVLSLVLVALALLLRLLMAASELRVPELALASLRGLANRQLWALGLSEPLLVVALAVPVGALIGPLLALFLVRWWLVPGLPLPLPATSLLAASLVVVAAVAVAVLAVGLVLRMSLAGQLTGVRRPTRSSRISLVGQLLLTAAVLAVLISKLSGGKPGRPDATDLVLPVLLAVFAGLMATRVIAAVAKWWTRRRRTTRSLAGFVAARAISRRHEGTLVILPISAAIAVCVFGAGVYSSAGDWRESVAATRAPAAEVWSSDLPMSQVVGLTHDLDPDGTWLMAATTLQTTGPEFVVVDGPRLPAVASWPALWTPGTTTDDIASRFTPTGIVPSFEGTRLALTASQDTGTDLTVAVRLLTDQGELHSVFLDPFRQRPRTVIEDTPYCRTGCRIEGLTIGGTSAQPTEMQGTVRILRIAANGQEIDGALTDADWVIAPTSSGASALGSVQVDGPELVLAVDSGTGTGIARLSAGGIPRRLPVVKGWEATTETDKGAFSGAVRLDVDPVVTSESVPLLGPVGLMIDYTMLNTDRYVPDQDKATYVFADADTPESVRSALVERGMAPSLSLAAEQRALDQSAYALALRLYAVVAMLVLAMALAGLVVSTAVQLPARRRDAAAMRVVGVRRGTVMSAVAREFLIVLGGAAVAGIAAGSLAQYVVLRTITLGYVEGLSTPRLVAAIDWTQIGIWTGIATIVLGVAAFFSASLTVRGARGSTLRENAR